MGNRYTEKKKQLQEFRNSTAYKQLDDVTINELLENVFIQNENIKNNMIYIANKLIDQNKLKRNELTKFIAIFEMLEMMQDLKQKIKTEKFNTKFINTYIKLNDSINNYLDYFNLKLMSISLNDNHPAKVLLNAFK